MALVKDFVNVIVNLETLGQSQFIPTIPEVDITAAIWQPGAASTHAAFLAGSYTLGGATTSLNFLDNSNVTYSGSADANIVKTVAIGGRTAFEFSIVASDAVSTDQNAFIEYQSDAANRVGFVFFPSMGMVRAFQVVDGIKSNVGDPIPYTLGDKTLIVFDSTQPTGVGLGIVIGNTIFTRPTDLIVSTDSTLVQNLGFETLSGSHVTRAFVNNGNIPFVYVIPSGFYPMGLVLAPGDGGGAGDFVGKNFNSFTTTTLQFLTPEDSTGTVVSLDASATAIDGHAGVYRKRKTTVGNDQIVEFWSTTAPIASPLYGIQIYESGPMTWRPWHIQQGSAGGSPWYPGGDGESNLFDPVPFVAPVNFPLEILGPSQIKIDSSSAAGQLSDFGVIDEPTVEFQGNRYVELLPFDMNNTGTLETAFSVTSDTGEEIGVFFTVNGSNITAAQFYIDGFSDSGVPTTPLLTIPIVNGQTIGLAFEMLPATGNLIVTATTATDEVIQDTGIAFVSGVNWTPVFKAITNSLSSANVYDTSWTINTGYFPYVHDVPAGFHPSGRKEKNWTPSYNPLINPFDFAAVSTPANIVITNNRRITYDTSGAGGNTTIDLLSKCGGALYLEFTPISSNVGLTDVHFQFSADPVATFPGGTSTLGFVYSFADLEFSLFIFDGTTPTTLLDTISLGADETVCIGWDMANFTYFISNVEDPLQQAAGTTTGALEFDDGTVFTPSFTQINDTSIIIMELNLGQYPFNGPITEGHTPVVLFENGVRPMTQPEATAGTTTGSQSISAKILGDTIDAKIAAIPPVLGVDHISADFFPTLGTYDGLTRDNENGTINSSFAGSGFRGTLSSLVLVDGAIWELTALAPDTGIATGKVSMTIFSGSGAGNYSISYDFSTSTFEVRNEAGVDLVGATVGTFAAAIGEPVQFEFENRDGTGGPNTPRLSLRKGASPVFIDVINLDVTDQQGIGVQGENNANGKLEFGLTRSQLTQIDNFTDFPNNVLTLIDANYLSGAGTPGGLAAVNLGANSGFRLFDDTVETVAPTTGVVGFTVNEEITATGLDSTAIVRTGTRFNGQMYFEFTPDPAILADALQIVFARVNPDGTQGGNPAELAIEYNRGTDLLRVGSVSESATEFTFTAFANSTGVASASDTYGVTVTMVQTGITNLITWTVVNLTTNDTEVGTDLNTDIKAYDAVSLIVGFDYQNGPHTGTHKLNLGQVDFVGVVPDGVAPPAWVDSVPFNVADADVVNRASAVKGLISVDQVLGAFVGAGLNSVRIGTDAGSTNQGTNAIAISRFAGQTDQGFDAIGIGRSAGQFSQGSNAISIGQDAGQFSQGSNAVSIGSGTGERDQGTLATAVGTNAGFDTQGDRATAVGFRSGGSRQGASAVALGDNAGGTDQGASAVSIGPNAGETSQGGSAIAIGASAGQTNQEANGVHIKTPDFDFEYVPSTKVLAISNLGADLILTLNGVRAGTATATAAELVDVNDPINTLGKGAGVMVYNTTLELPFWATGSAAGADWKDATGGTVISPI